MNSANIEHKKARKVIVKIGEKILQKKQYYQRQRGAFHNDKEMN